MYHPQRNRNGPLERTTSGAILGTSTESPSSISATGSDSKLVLTLLMVPCNVPPVYGVAFFPHHSHWCVLFSFCETLLTYLTTSSFSTLEYFTQRFSLILGSMITLFSVTSALIPAQCHGRVSEFEGFYNKDNSSISQLCFQGQKLLISSKYTKRSNDKVTENE